jgi:hypothetical protein
VGGLAIGAMSTRNYEAFVVFMIDHARQYSRFNDRHRDRAEWHAPASDLPARRVVADPVPVFLAVPARCCATHRDLDLQGGRTRRSERVSGAHRSHARGWRPASRKTPSGLLQAGRTTGAGVSRRRNLRLRRRPVAEHTHHQLGFGSGGYTGTAGTKPFRFGISTLGRLLASMTSFSPTMPFRYNRNATTA